MLDQVLALAVGGEGLDAQVPGECGQVVLARADPLAPHLDHLAVADRLVERPPADPVAGLDDEHLAAPGGQLAGGHQPGQPGADHHDFRFVSGHRHRRYLRAG